MESKECGCGLCTEFVGDIARCPVPCRLHHDQCQEWQAACNSSPSRHLCGCEVCNAKRLRGQTACPYPCEFDSCGAWEVSQRTSTTGSRAASLLRRIADTLEQKAAYYGDSISKAPILVPGMPIETAALVRASDKIARIQHGSGDTTDAWVDLIGYAALVLVMRNAEVD